MIARVLRVLRRRGFRLRFDGRLACDELGSEASGLLAGAGLEVARWDLDTEVAVACRSAAEVADEGEEGGDLASGENEVDGVDGLGPILAGEPLDGLEVVAPVATAHDVGRYRFVGEQPGGRLGEHEGTHRHAGCQPPGRRTDAHQVIVAVCLCGDAYLADLSSKLGPAHPENV